MRNKKGSVSVIIGHVAFNCRRSTWSLRLNNVHTADFCPAKHRSLAKYKLSSLKVYIHLN